MVKLNIKSDKVKSLRTLDCRTCRTRGTGGGGANVGELILSLGNPTKSACAVGVKSLNYRIQRMDDSLEVLRLLISFAPFTTPFTEVLGQQLFQTKKKSTLGPFTL